MIEIIVPSMLVGGGIFYYFMRNFGMKPFTLPPNDGEPYSPPITVDPWKKAERENLERYWREIIEENRRLRERIDEIETRPPNIQPPAGDPRL